MIALFLSRAFLTLKLNKFFGPFVKIITSMLNKLGVFLIIYLVNLVTFTAMFSVVYLQYPGWTDVY